MSDKFNKKAYEPMNISIGIFILGLLLGWLFGVLGFDKMAMGCQIVGVLAFFYAVMNSQRLINRSINDKLNEDKD